MVTSQSIAAIVASALLPLTEAASLRARAPAGQSYTFAQFIQEFDRDYDTGSAEYADRKALFGDSLEEIQIVNARNAREGRKWTANVHPFMDWSPEEREILNQGYKAPASRRSARANGLVGIQTEQRSSVLLNATWDPTITTSPEHPTPPIRQQGRCGSCWAFSAVEAVEAQILRNDASQDARLSPQALVDCVPNPNHCGGSGGCHGATGELALGYMSEYGIPMERDVPYTAKTGQCNSAEASRVGTRAPWPSGQRAVVSGFDLLPTNQQQPLMQALVETGPVVVAVSASAWHNYGGGIFDGCQKDAVIGHAVLATGYGEEADTKYFRIQNSWGANWGESGHIRLLRHDDEKEWCGIDHEPQKGNGCDGGPPEVPVCGMCGILYDMVVPRGARIEQIGDDTPASSVSDSFGAADSPVGEPSLSSLNAATTTDMTTGSRDDADALAAHAGASAEVPPPPTQPEPAASNMATETQEADLPSKTPSSDAPVQNMEEADLPSKTLKSDSPLLDMEAIFGVHRRVTRAPATTSGVDAEQSS